MSMRNGSDPTAGMGRLDRLGVHRAWHEERIYDRGDWAELYPLGNGDKISLRLPTARIITKKHLGLEIKAPPDFRLGDAEAEKWLTRILTLNGLRGSMRAAAEMKSWAGDVGLLFAYRPSEAPVFGTPWQVAFIAPETYDVVQRHPSGVFKAVDVYSYEDKDSEVRLGEMERWWSRTQYTTAHIRRWPKVRGSLDDAVRPPAAAFDAAVAVTQPVSEVTNTMGVIPFVVIQNVTSGTQTWEGESDYAFLTHLFHRLNVHLDGMEQGEQIRNRLMMALIDAEDVSAEVAQGLTALMIQSRQDGTDERQAQLVPTPLMQGQPSTFLQTLLDLVMEAAGVAQTGGARELFGNEAASSSALHAFYSLQTAVAEHKRQNWLGERADYGLSAFVRKLIGAAGRVDSTSPVQGADVTDDRYDLVLNWPPMFAPSAPERQTLSSVAQQAQDDGLPAEHIAPVWATALGATGVKAVNEIAAALKKRQQQVEAGGLLRPTGTAKRGILGSGQGDGQNPDGGSATRTENPE